MIRSGACVTWQASAHCDSFDGPALTDVVKLLDTSNVELVKK